MCAKSVCLVIFLARAVLSCPCVVLHCQCFHYCSLLEECLNCVHLLVAAPSSRTCSR